jgi:hypothetical protein
MFIFHTLSKVWGGAILKALSKCNMFTCALWRVAISMSRQNFFFLPKTGKTGKKPAKPSQNRMNHFKNQKNPRLLVGMRTRGVQLNAAVMALSAMPPPPPASAPGHLPLPPYHHPAPAQTLTKRRRRRRRRRR